MVVDKIVEEARELSEAQGESDPDHLAEEYGDLLFVIANLGRHLNIDQKRPYATQIANSHDGSVSSKPS